MDLAPIQQLIKTPELRKHLRQLCWFNRAFAANTQLVSAHFGMVARVDEAKLQRMFFDWAAAIEPAEHDHATDRRDRIVFMGGLA